MPFAVVVEEYRYLAEAEKTKKRLENMGLEPYLIAQRNEEMGLWFKVMLGASKYLEDMTSSKIDYEDKYRLQDIQIANFNQIKPELVPVDSFSSFTGTTNLEKPEVDVSFYELLGWLPHHPDFRLKHLLLFNPQDSFNINRLATIKSNQADWPRGLGQKEVTENALCFAEARYIDEVSGKKITLQSILFKKDNQYEGDLVSHFADRILETREYDLEEKLPFVVGEDNSLTGYKVNISPREGLIKRYFVLADGAQRVLFFIQSDNNAEVDMELISHYLGREQGLTTYPYFQVFFNLLPESFPNDNLVFLDLEFIDDATGSLQYRLPGHFQCEFVFLNDLNGIWHLDLMKTYEPEMAQSLFGKFYKWNRKVKKEEIILFGNQGYLSYATRRQKNSRKYKKVVNEIQFFTSHYVGSLSNKNHGYLEEADLLEKLESFRFKPGKFSRDESQSSSEPL